MGEEVSWRLITRGMPVIGRDGLALGRVTRLLGDPQRDIFDGVALRRGLFGPEAEIDQARIVRITARCLYVQPCLADLAPPAAPQAPAPGRALAARPRRRRWPDRD